MTETVRHDTTAAAPTTPAPATPTGQAVGHPLPGARSHEHLRNYPPVSDWDNHVEFDAKAHPRKVPHSYMLVPTTCFNCESACGLLAYVDKDDLSVKKVEGNPAHPGSRGRNCAKGPATINQVNDPERVLYPLRRTGERGGGGWERVSWDDALDDVAGRIRAAIVEGRGEEVTYHVGRPGEDGFAERVLQAWGVDGHNSHTQVCSSGARFGQTLWGGYDRPSPDHAHAKVILLFSSHLETGHYFNPHAQRIMEGKQSGAKLIVVDPRMSNTAAHA
ncbi:MAG: molybdopterin-dependent oxidoreductase, partial [Pseudonocardia sp.]|nr:molybdopterin-dependent oxidoreductase [Pseudonocardia sp.]